MGTDTASASRYAEKSQGKEEKPPTSRTIDGTAVATMVESMATSPVDSIKAMRIGPRSERNPTPWARAVIISLVSVFLGPCYLHSRYPQPTPTTVCPGVRPGAGRNG